MARLTGGLHVSDHTNASRTLLYNLAGARRDDEPGAVLGARGMLPEIVPSAGVLGEVREEHLGFRLSIAGLAGEPAGGALRAGMHAYRPGQEHLRHRCISSSCTRAARVPQPAAGLLGTVAYGPQGEPAYAIGKRIHCRSRHSVASRRTCVIDDGVRNAGTRHGRGGHRRSHFRAGICRTGHAAWKRRRVAPSPASRAALPGPWRVRRSSRSPMERPTSFAP